MRLSANFVTKYTGHAGGKKRGGRKGKEQEQEKPGTGELGRLGIGKGMEYGRTNKEREGLGRGGKGLGKIGKRRNRER